MTPTRAQLHQLNLPSLYAHFEATGLIRRLLELSRDEDLSTAPSSAGSGDLTSDCCIDPGKMATAQIVARGGGTISGLAAIPMLVEIFAPAVTATLSSSDGATLPPMTVLGTLNGPLDEILSIERTLLNLLGRLSGVATRTARFAAAIPSASRARLFDTRKTTPGLRVLEKYAVRCGGGYSHRIGLFDAVLIKDNHLVGVPAAQLPSFVTQARAKAMARGTPAFLEVEVDSFDQLEALLTLPPGVIDIILLDNMNCEQLYRASRRRDALMPQLELEASGGITLDTITSIAATGVDRISVGGLTHSATSIDVALDIVSRSK